jgi:hypothetical protein
VRRFTIRHTIVGSPLYYLNIIAASNCRQNFVAPKSPRQLLLQSVASGLPRCSLRIQAAQGSANTDNRERGHRRGCATSNPLPIGSMNTKDDSAFVSHKTASADKVHEAGMPTSLFKVAFPRSLQCCYANIRVLTLSCSEA